MSIRRVRAAIVVAAIMALTLLTTTLAPAGASAGRSAGDAGGNGRCHAGAPGVGDAYYPLYGNGGYDVKHYLLKVSYDPATDRLAGVARISARATENLCRFNLDFQGMTVRSVKVDGRRAGWSRSQDHELTVTPQHKLKKGQRFTTVVRYDGMPRTQQIIIDSRLQHRGLGSSTPTTARSSPASPRWRPTGSRSTTTRLDKAAYTFVVTVPAGLEVVGNGRLVGRRTHGRLDHLGLERPRADGVLPGHGDHRAVRPALLPDGGRAADVRRARPRPVHRAGRPRGPRLADLRRDRARARWPARARSWTSWPSSSGPTRSPPAAGSSTTTTTSSSLWRTRPARSTPSSSSPTRSAATSWWSTRTPTSGTATAWPWPSGSTSGSTRASPPTPSGSGARHEGLGTTQEIFDSFYNDIPADDPFWDVVIGDPGVELLFDNRRVRAWRHDPAGAAQPGR